jgi:hypothetical protein
MKNTSTGTGLCVLGLCLASYPIIDRVMPRAEAGATHVAAVVAAATSQVPPEPTIVWYGTAGNPSDATLFRAWSDGRIEALKGAWDQATVQQGTNSIGYYKWNTYPGSVAGGVGRWQLVSSPSQGYTYRSDINFDSKVDGADLGTLLADWGDAPRHDVPPSHCPLNLINP